MKKGSYMVILFFCVTGFSYGQFKYSSEFPVNFKINSVTIGQDENIVNVSGNTPDDKWTVKMT